MSSQQPKRQVTDTYYAPGEDQAQLARPGFFLGLKARWPRGYTPGRWAEVNKALEKTNIDSDVQDAVQPDRQELGALIKSPRTRERRLFEADMVKQAIARSTMPVENLKGLKTVLTGTKVGPGSRGNYTEGFNVGDGLHLPTAHIKLGGAVGGGRVTNGEGEEMDLDSLRGNAASRALLHEVGHHVENIPRLEKGEEFVADQSEQAIGQGEASAENYADEHHRPDHRAPAETVPSGYDEQLVGVWEGKRGHSTFTESYEQHRNLNLTQFNQRWPTRKWEQPVQETLF